MVQPKIRLLSTEQKASIHQRSMDVLYEVGMYFGSHAALELFADAGCDVDWPEGSAKIAGDVIERALITVPSRFLAAGIDPALDLEYGGEKLFYTSAGQSSWYRDLDTRQRRPGTLADLIQCTRLVDAIDEIDIHASMVLPRDVPTELQGLESLRVALGHSRKHFLGGARDLRTLPFVLEMMDAVLGDRKRLAERPIFTLITEPASPLRNKGPQVDVTLEWAPYKVPVGFGTMPMSGATSPASLAGTVLLANAEFLGNMTLYQLAQPGWPISWTAMPATLDMRSGRLAVGVESALMSVALIEMAQFYAVPCEAMHVCAVDAKSIGFQSGMESIFVGLINALAGADGLWGPADLDCYSMVDPAFLYLAVESVRQINRILEGIDLDEERFLFDAIGEIRFSGGYLGHPSTKRYFRQEHLRPSVFPRESYEAWEARARSEETLAVARVKEILSDHVPASIPGHVSQELERIVLAARKTLCGA
jgi:trimethylamine--corrinoid protein Co-methyltransferase